MKTYRRTEHTPHGFRRETTVTTKGSYCAVCIWDDGVITEICTTTLSEMGWPSTAAFLRERKGFEEVPA